MVGSIKDINTDQGYFYPVFIFNPLSTKIVELMSGQNMLTLGYELNEKQAHTVIHCNPSPQGTAGPSVPL